ncbi:class I SAM-dependent methyltransferase [Polycladidibacter stylochi]|uniref:class I SAM-dependent methyltransferase n=1 Tax=Polycladidibacter stylochi TaxID=1807766 RepID=UPI00082B4B9C|nr:class I SAM-dependent methyltransferase [Pseudovibrio stylochi]
MSSITKHKAQIDSLKGAMGGTISERNQWFNEVYLAAHEDAEKVPWAECKPKSELVNWLQNNPGDGTLKALDVGCGLGDNTQTLNENGYQAEGFDIAPAAIQWAQKRFSSHAKRYHCADLFDPPSHWVGKYDLIYECYTLQALERKRRIAAVSALKKLLVPNGRLLILSRYSPQMMSDELKPPLPLVDQEIAAICNLNMNLFAKHFTHQMKADGRQINHIMLELVNR